MVHMQNQKGGAFGRADLGGAVPQRRALFIIEKRRAIPAKSGNMRIGDSIHARSEYWAQNEKNL